MTVSVAVVQQAASTSIGTQDFTVSGFGTPKAYLTFVGRATVNGTAAAEAQIAVGGGDGTRQWAFSVSSQDAAAAGNTRRRGTTDESILILQPTSTVVDGEANFDSFITDGVRLNWGNDPGSGWLVQVVLFGGTDLSAYAGVGDQIQLQDVAQSFTGPGFEPDAIFFATDSRNFDDTAGTNIPFSIGFSVNSTPIRQFAASINDDNGDSPSDVYGMSQDNRVQSVLSQNDAGVTRDAEVTNYEASGFELTKRSGDSSVDFGYLALHFNGVVSTDVRQFTSPTSTGNFSRTAFSFTPQFVMVLPTFTPTINTYENSGANGAGAACVSIMDSTNQYCIGMSSEDGQVTTDTQSLVDNQAVNMARDDGTIVFNATLSSFDANGYTLNFATTDGTARQWAEWAIGEEAPAGAPAAAQYYYRQQRA